MTRERGVMNDGAVQRAALWLSLRVGHNNWLFEFAPGEERAIVVGCLPRANVRIEQRGVAPLHFHFEREGDSIYLIPGYRDELLLNGVSVKSARLLESRSLIEFAGIQLEAAFFSLEPEQLAPACAHDRTAASSSPQKQGLRSLPDSADPTRVAFRPPLRPLRKAMPPLPQPRATPPIVPRPILAVGWSRTSRS